MPILQGLAVVCVNIFCRFVQNIPIPPIQRYKNTPISEKNTPEETSGVP